MPILPQDITVGKQFHYWTVIGDIYLDRVDEYRKRYFVPCRCVCGQARRVSLDALGTFRAISCGCVKRGLIIKPGDRFGRLTIIGPVERGRNGTKFLCLCDCGIEKAVLRSLIVSGNVKSCGCLRREKKSSLTHGGTKTPLYSTWSSMRERCRNQVRYAGRGITVCPEWENFSVFREWSMANGYSPELTIDRIDNDGNYFPANCRWTTMKVQSNNKSSSLYLSAFGEVKTMALWLEDLRCTVAGETIRRRLKEGWTQHDAVAQPPYASKRPDIFQAHKYL